MTLGGQQSHGNWQGPFKFGQLRHVSSLLSTVKVKMIYITWNLQYWIFSVPHPHQNSCQKNMAVTVKGGTSSQVFLKVWFLKAFKQHALVPFNLKLLTERLGMVPLTSKGIPKSNGAYENWVKFGWFSGFNSAVCPLKLEKLRFFGRTHQNQPFEEKNWNWGQRSRSRSFNNFV